MDQQLGKFGKACENHIATDYSLTLNAGFLDMELVKTT
jgi:hypothetical protein